MVMDTKGMGIEPEVEPDAHARLHLEGPLGGPGGRGRDQSPDRAHPDAGRGAAVHAVRVRLRDVEGGRSRASRPWPGCSRREVGAEFTFKMKPTGEIVDIKVPAETLKRLPRGRRPAGGPGPRSPRRRSRRPSCRRARRRSPRTPLEPGKTWTAQAGPGAPPALRRAGPGPDLHLQGPDPKSPNLVLIGIDTDGQDRADRRGRRQGRRSGSRKGKGA